MSQLDSFLEDLRRALSALPRGVADGAIQYYTEYFADARQAGVPEEEILRRTGSVEQVAAAITDDAAITAAENRPGPRSLLRTSRRLLGRDARQARSHRLVGVGRAARGTSLAFVSLFPLAAAILLYITAFALLAGTAAVAIALAVSLASHPALAANDRLAQIGLIAGLAALGLILTLLVYRAGHAFGRMTLALFRRIAARPEPAARAAAAGATDASTTGANAADVVNTAAASAGMDDRASAAGSAGAASSVGKASKLKPVLAPTVDAPRPRQHRRALWRVAFALLLVIATAGFTTATVFGLPQAYVRLWNSQTPAGIEPVFQGVSDQAVRQLTIVTLNSNIVVQPSSSRYITYSYEQPPYFQIERTITDGSVVLTEKSNGRLPLIDVLAAHEGMTTLTVQVPVDPNLELTIRTAGGRVDIQVPSRTLKVRTGSGSLNLHGRVPGPGDEVISGGQVLYK